MINSTCSPILSRDGATHINDIEIFEMLIVSIFSVRTNTKWNLDRLKTIEYPKTVTHWQFCRRKKNHHQSVAARLTTNITTCSASVARSGTFTLCYHNINHSVRYSILATLMRWPARWQWAPSRGCWRP